MNKSITHVVWDINLTILLRKKWHEIAFISHINIFREQNSVLRHDYSRVDNFWYNMPIRYEPNTKLWVRVKKSDIFN